ncbi:MAG TPA: hypothetical protein VIS99_17100 [Terrimicrobiaceae bacterium]
MTDTLLPFHPSEAIRSAIVAADNPSIIGHYGLSAVVELKTIGVSQKPSQEITDFGVSAIQDARHRARTEALNPCTLDLFCLPFLLRNRYSLRLFPRYAVSLCLLCLPTCFGFVPRSLQCCLLKEVGVGKMNDLAGTIVGYPYKLPARCSTATLVPRGTEISS